MDNKEYRRQYNKAQWADPSKRQKNLEYMREYKRRRARTDKKFKDAVREWNKKYVEQNKDKIAEYGKKYRKENPELCKEQHRNWYKNNVEKVKQDWQKYYNENKIEHNIRVTENQKNNPEKYLPIKRQAVRKRRDIAVVIQESYSKDDEQYTRNLFENKCIVCQCDNNLCIDHWYPLYHGYALTRENATLMCRACNSKKSNKYPEEIYDENFIRDIEEKLKG